jgi:hypothetical protein
MEKESYQAGHSWPAGSDSPDALSRLTMLEQALSERRPVQAPDLLKQGSGMNGFG